jgi:hypothetical protein
MPQNEVLYRHLGSITSGTVVTEKTLINPHRPACSMDGMDSISSSRHEPPPYQQDPLAVSRSQAQRTLFISLAESLNLDFSYHLLSWPSPM